MKLFALVGAVVVLFCQLASGFMIAPSAFAGSSLVSPSNHAKHDRWRQRVQFLVFPTPLCPPPSTRVATGTLLRQGGRSVPVLVVRPLQHDECERCEVTAGRVCFACAFANLLATLGGGRQKGLLSFPSVDR